VVLRLLVIDGADQGSFYLLPEGGKILVGNRQKQANICLNDFYVAPVHCEVAVGAGKVTVCARATPAGTLISGKRITQPQELLPTEVLRVGNSHLRLDAADDATAWGQADELHQPGAAPRLPVNQKDGLTDHTLGHFEVGRMIGRGHTGVVYRARDLKKNQEVALKVLDPEFPHDDEEMQNLIKALKVRFGLTHAKLVTLYGAGKTGPYCWIATEFIVGESLAQLIENQRTLKKIKWRRALNVAMDIGRAMVFLHQNHQRHGNITPQNILIQSSDEAAKLNDLLYLSALEGSVLRQKTLEKKLLAELPYLSPEQTDPSSKWVDDLSDMYSLGVVIYAVLTGRTPFGGGTPEETLRQIREDVPVRPSKLQKSVPDQFQAVVLKMLAKHPEERYATPAVMLADLERLATQFRDAI
jgi:eukaryotic-like serine/threonine-protein kinase